MARLVARSSSLIGRLLKDHRGAGAVEFALIVPLALVLTLGGVETGRAISANAAITQAAKETARFASVRGAASGAAATQEELQAMALDLADLDVAATTATVVWAPDNSPGGTVTVQLQHEFTPVAMPFKGSTFTFNATAAMTVVR